jgi:hypothetical protein
MFIRSVNFSLVLIPEMSFLSQLAAWARLLRCCKLKTALLLLLFSCPAYKLKALRKCLQFLSGIKTGLKIILISIIIIFSQNSIAAITKAAIDDVDTVYPLPIFWKGLKVLHIGDSNLKNKGLTLTLRRHITEAGGIYKIMPQKGSRSKSWITSGRFKKALKEINPDIVIINLGTNAIKISKPQKYSVWIKTLVKKTGRKKCYWIAPPKLIEDKYGFYKMLKTASHPCKYFDTTLLPFKNEHKNRYHLSNKQATIWAEAIWKWMNDLKPPGAYDGF